MPPFVNRRAGYLEQKVHAVAIPSAIQRSDTGTPVCVGGVLEKCADKRWAERQDRLTSALVGQLAL